MTPVPVPVAAALLLAAVFLFLFTRQQRRLGGLPEGDLIYNDNAAGDCPVLVSHRHGLKGKPDALVRTESGDVIPVERKKTRAPRRGPYDGDLIQATAYCILVEEETGRTPPFMRIQICRPLVRRAVYAAAETMGAGGMRPAPASAPRVRLPPLPPDCRQMPQLRAGTVKSPEGEWPGMGQGDLELYTGALFW